MEQAGLPSDILLTSDSSTYGKAAGDGAGRGDALTPLTLHLIIIMGLVTTALVVVVHCFVVRFSLSFVNVSIIPSSGFTCLFRSSHSSSTGSATAGLRIICVCIIVICIIGIEVWWWCSDGVDGGIKSYIGISNNDITITTTQEQYRGTRVIITGGNLTDNMSGRPTYIEYISPITSSSSVGGASYMNDNNIEWSRIQCIGWHRNRSCAFDNIYYHKTNDEFYIILPLDPILRGYIMRAPYNGYAINYNNTNTNHHDNTGIPVTEDSINDLIKGCSVDPKDWSPFRPSIKLFNNTKIVDVWLKQQHDDIINIDDISGTFNLFWAFNVGHAIYDNIYPFWITIIRFGYLNKSIKLFPRGEGNGKRSDNDYEHLTVIDAISHSQVTFIDDIIDNSTYRFNRLLVGCRWMGHRNQQRHMGMPGSYSYENALYWYGQRILAGYGILDWDKALNPNTPIIINNNNKCKGVITDNKRYSIEEREMLKSLANNSIELFGCDIIYMNWKDYTFKQQLELFANMNIYISAVGTGMTRCHLIKPGGVIVHLGEMDHTLDTRYQVSYRDVHMAVGSPHLNSVYYSRKLWNIFGRLIREGVIDVINKGINLFNNGYPIPRPYNDGLSPTSLSYERYCADSSDDCSSLSDSMNGGALPGQSNKIRYHCEYCSWIDYFGIGPAWSNIGCIDPDDSTLIHCPINIKRWNSILTQDDINDHIAFNKTCYDNNIPYMAKVRQKTLEDERNRRYKQGVVGHLSNDESLQLLLKISPPNCPYISPIKPEKCIC